MGGGEGGGEGVEEGVRVCEEDGRRMGWGNGEYGCRDEGGEKRQ